MEREGERRERRKVGMEIPQPKGTTNKTRFVDSSKATSTLPHSG